MLCGMLSIKISMLGIIIPLLQLNMIGTCHSMDFLQCFLQQEQECYDGPKYKNSSNWHITVEKDSLFGFSNKIMLRFLQVYWWRDMKCWKHVYNLKPVQTKCVATKMILNNQPFFEWVVAIFYYSNKMFFQLLKPVNINSHYWCRTKWLSVFKTTVSTPAHKSNDKCWFHNSQFKNQTSLFICCQMIFLAQWRAMCYWDERGNNSCSLWCLFPFYLPSTHIALFFSLIACEHYQKWSECFFFLLVYDSSDCTYHFNFSQTNI